jgi:hypothetical protein
VVLVENAADEKPVPQGVAVVVAPLTRVNAVPLALEATELSAPVVALVYDSICPNPANEIPMNSSKERDLSIKKC